MNNKITRANNSELIDNFLNLMAQTQSTVKTGMTNKELAAIVVDRLHTRLEDMGLSDIIMEVTADVLAENGNHLETDEDYDQGMDICSRIYIISE